MDVSRFVVESAAFTRETLPVVTHVSRRVIVVQEVGWTYLEDPASCMPMATMPQRFCFRLDQIAYVTEGPRFCTALSCVCGQWLEGGYTQPKLSMRDTREDPGGFFQDQTTYDVNGFSVRPRSQKNASGSRRSGTRLPDSRRDLATDQKSGISGRNQVSGPVSSLSS